MNKSDFERGWEFASKLVGSNIAAELGSNYFNLVSGEIDNFNNLMLSLSSRSASTDASLSGFVAEYWHTGSFNVNSVASGSTHMANVVGSTGYGSVDVGTNFGADYGLKYYSTAEKSMLAQAEYSRELGMHKYHGQKLVVPTDQLDEARKLALKRVAKNQNTRPEIAESYNETASTLTDRISDGEGAESIPLTKNESMQQAREIKNETYDVREHGASESEIIKANYIVSNAINAGINSATISMVMQLVPEIYKTIDYLIKTKEIEPEQLKKMGVTAIKSGTEGFIRGSVAYSLVVYCKMGKFGAAMKSLSPTVIASTVSIVMETIKNGIMVAIGKMSASEMGAKFVDNVVITTGIISGMKLGAAIGQILGIQMPVFGYLLGSLIGCAFSVVYNIGKNKFISFCVDTGFTCFGLVEQDYMLPEELLDTLGVNIVPVNRTNINKVNVSTININRNEVKYNRETVELRIVKRGIIGVNKVGYVY